MDRWKTYLSNGLKGMLIGIANAIPGVSGGTIAVITGIYEPLIEALASLSSRNGEWKRKIPAALPILIPVAIGVAVGLVGFANVIDLLFRAVPVQTQFLFMGLILGSLPFLVKLSGQTRFRPSFLVPLVAGIGLLVWLTLMNWSLGDRDTLIQGQQVIRTLEPLTVLTLVGAGMAGTAAMVVPGVSGSFLLVVMGLYGTFKGMLVEFNIPVIGVFGVGAILGLVLVAKVLEVLLKHFHGHTYFGIIGLVIGSVMALWPRGADLLNPLLATTSLLAGGLGFGAAFFLGADKKPRDAGIKE